jgi:hypothetical protein
MRLKDWVASLAAMTAISASGAAMAAPVEDEFVRICLASSSVPDAHARARAAGFVTAPAELRARLKAFPQNADLLWRADEGEVMIFMAMTIAQGRKNAAGLAFNGDGCVVGSMPSQPDLGARIERVLEVGPAQPFGKTKGYIFEQTPSGPVRLDVTDKAAIIAKMPKSSVRVVSPLERAGASALMQIIVRVSSS